MTIWQLGKRKEERRIARQVELAEMEDRNRDVSAKVDELKRILSEVAERKRGQNDR